MPHAEGSSDHTVDLSDLPIEAAMAVAGRDLMRGVVSALLHIARACSRDGLSTEDANMVLEHSRIELEDWRKKSLADLRGWLERGCATLN